MIDLDQLLKAVSQCLARYEAHSGDAPLTVAVSGGRDSTVLAWVLARLHTSGRIATPPLVAHVDHGVHERSGAAAEQVRQLCEDLGLSFASERLQEAGRSEDTLRRARYAALSRMARAAGGRLILTAHHAEDNLETVLFRMMRGTGPRGLAGIPEYRPLGDGLAVVRPLLRIPPATLYGVLEKLSLGWSEDPTNQDRRYARNRLRHEVLPALRAQLGTKLDQSLTEVAENARTINELVDAQALRVLGRAARFVAPWRCELTLDPSGQESAFLAEALCKIYERLHPTHARPPWSWVRRTLDLFHSDAGQRVDGDKYLLVERTRGGLLIMDPTAAGQTPENPIEVPEAGAVQFGTTEWTVQSTLHPTPPLSPSPTESGPSRALLDPREAPRPWRLRPRRNGDRFWPLGAAGSVDLRRFVQNRHLPRFDRNRLPLVVDAADRVLWVPGVEISHRDRIRLDTRSTWELNLGIVGSAPVQGRPY